MILLIARPRAAHSIDVAVRIGTGDPFRAPLCGNLCMPAKEWDVLKAILLRGRSGVHEVMIEEPKDET